jgi:DNA-binding IclR family transcriptional regulator
VSGSSVGSVARAIALLDAVAESDGGARNATAAGKVMLAFWFDQLAFDPDAELPAFTERTITDPGVLAAELDRVRTAGVGEAVGEREPDLNALAAPVLGRGGELVAILGLQGPAARLPAATRRGLRDPLLRAAREVSQSLGGPG